MSSARQKLDALRSAARERGLTPVAWWIGRRHHDAVLDELGDEPSTSVEAGRLVEIDGLDVKVLTESSERFALWCEEGALDL